MPVLVAVELALRAGGLFVEEVGQMPEQLVEVGLEARVAERAGKDVEQVRDGAGDKVGFGKRAGIGLAGCCATVRTSLLLFLDLSMAFLANPRPFPA